MYKHSMYSLFASFSLWAPCLCRVLRFGRGRFGQAFHVALGLGYLQLLLHALYGVVLQAFALQNLHLSAECLVESGHRPVTAQSGVKVPLAAAVYLAHRPYRHWVLIQQSVLGPHR